MEETAEVIAFPGASPEAEAGRREIRDMLAAAIDKLPEPFRLVFVMREIEELDIAETAATLGIKPETVKTRLFRARRLIREALAEGSPRARRRLPLRRPALHEPCRPGDRELRDV